ncbi:hypothetical protein [Maribacter sp. 2308TA10-17]|uniref:hypothetical protein n=1 Tax=Maribacter sp. 2308TA10-17 TaxID=3386276 RepID=UPI0039BD7B3B
MKVLYKLAAISLLLMMSCGGGGDDGPPPTPMPDPVADPKATTLIFPENNTECNEGVIVDDARSSVTFRWNASEDTDEYEVNLRNLISNETTLFKVFRTEASITIDRGSPYEWFVTSSANGTTVTASSSIFKFYNQGPGIENYAPFPAEAVSPIRGADVTNTTGTLSLEWNGSDIDDDITEFEVLFGTEAIPNISVGTTTDQTFEVTVLAGNTYYWRVISSDSQGNTSQSEIFEFKVSS